MTKRMSVQGVMRVLLSLLCLMLFTYFVSLFSAGLPEHWCSRRPSSATSLMMMSGWQKGAKFCAWGLAWLPKTRRWFLPQAKQNYIKFSIEFLRGELFVNHECHESRDEAPGFITQRGDGWLIFFIRFLSDIDLRYVLEGQGISNRVPVHVEDLHRPRCPNGSSSFWIRTMLELVRPFGRLVTSQVSWLKQICQSCLVILSFGDLKAVLTQLRQNIANNIVDHILYCRSSRRPTIHWFSATLQALPMIFPGPWRWRWGDQRTTVLHMHLLCRICSFLGVSILESS